MFDHKELLVYSERENIHEKFTIRQLSGVCVMTYQISGIHNRQREYRDGRNHIEPQGMEKTYLAGK